MTGELRTPDSAAVAALEEQLNSFDLAARTDALDQLLALADADPAAPPPRLDIANMHCHTFFSYSPYGHTPTRLAWLARQQRIGLMGIVDFDTLDGADEFLAACARAGIRGSVGLETRTFIPEFAAYEINSVGEPGVYYHMGIGFTTRHIPPDASALLDAMCVAIVERNRGIVARLNDYLAPLRVDYDEDVLPLTPSGNATERHIVVAFMQQAERHIADLAGFWGERLALPRDQAEDLVRRPDRLQNAARVKLMKRGGVAYVPPDPRAFPSVEQFHRFIVASGAIPCATWLDGTSVGEQRTEALLDLLIAKGVATLNIIPDRNWNVPDPALREVKIRNLHEVVALAGRLDLPIIVGTELNNPGQKLVDDFDAPALAPVRAAFLEGAYFIYGHTVAQREANLGYQSAWAQAHLPSRRARNDFYAALGRRVEPGAGLLRALGPRAADLTPTALLEQASR